MMRALIKRIIRSPKNELRLESELRNNQTNDGRNLKAQIILIFSNMWGKYFFNELIKKLFRREIRLKIVLISVV